MTMSRLLLAGVLVMGSISAALGGEKSAPNATSNATPDAARGEPIYTRCLACHALAYDRVGPRHCGLFGRRAGSVPGFS